MKKPVELRTFIRLGKRELEFVRTLQRLVQKKTGRKRQPPVDGIINGVLLDYKRFMEIGADPDFLKAYEEIKARRRRPRKDCSAPNQVC